MILFASSKNRFSNGDILDKVHFYPALYIFLIDLYLILLAAKLSGIHWDFTLPRIILLSLCGCLTALYIIRGLLRFKWKLLFFALLIYINYLLVSNRTGEQIEVLFQFMYSPLIFLAAIVVFRNLNKRTYDWICNMKFGFLLAYFSIFLYMFLTLDYLNGVFKNTTYFQLALIPFILSSPSKFRIVFGLILVAVSGMLIGKITVLLLAITSILFFIIANMTNERRNSDLKSFRNLMVFFIFGFVLLYISFLFEFKGVSRLATIFSDGGSGRIQLTTIFLESIDNLSLSEYFIGHGVGSASSQVIGGHSAHNDFLELFFRLGSIGLLIYLACGYLIVRAGKEIKKNDYYAGSVFLYIIIVFILFSSVSMLIFIPSYVVQFFLFWTMSIGYHLKIHDAMCKP